MKKNSIFLSTVVLCLIFFIAGYNNAKIYKYQDENGNWHFTDAPVDEQEAGESMEEAGAGNRGYRDLEVQLRQTVSPKSKIEEASVATIGIKTPAGFGSGFFVSNDGYIITNKHVLKGSQDQIKTKQENFRALEKKIASLKQKQETEEYRIKVAEHKLERFKASINEQRNSDIRRADEAIYNAHLDALNGWKKDFDDRQARLLSLENELETAKENEKANAEIIDIARHFTVFLADNTELYVYLVTTSEQHDLALLKLDGYKTPYIEPMNSNLLSQGESVYAVGNPMELRNSVAAGVLSGHEYGFVKTDARIYPGNSGGPLITGDGKVIGVNTFKILTKNFEGLGFAIPIYTALQEFDAYLSN